MKLAKPRVRAVLASVTIALLSTACQPDRARPEPDPTEWFVVNAATYNVDDMAPVNVAFTYVARWRGWTDAEIEAWRPFIVDDIIAKESRGCFNVRAGNVRFADPHGVGCVIARNGRGNAAGFGQVMIRHNAFLCENDGLCVPEDITLTAWDSMSAVLGVIEELGVRPWQYDAYSRRFHSTLKWAPAERPNQDG